MGNRFRVSASGHQKLPIKSAVFLFFSVYLLGSYASVHSHLALKHLLEPPHGRSYSRFSQVEGLSETSGLPSFLKSESRSNTVTRKLQIQVKQ